MEKGGEGVLERDPDGVPIDLFYLDIFKRRALGGGVSDVRGGYRRPVVPGSGAVEMEGVNLSVLRHLPGFGNSRLDLTLMVYLG